MQSYFSIGAIWRLRLCVGFVAAMHVATAQAWSAARLPDTTILGQSADAQMGGALNAQADLNADGYLDLISTQSGTNHRGVVEVRYGSRTGFHQKPDFRYEGSMDWALVGSSPQAIDVNGDGWPDLVVGAYGYSGAKQYAGAVLVFYGSPNGFPATPSQIIEGPEANSFFGFAIRSLGDFNRDGYGDLAVSAGADNGTTAKIFVYAGSRSGLVLQPKSTLSAPMPFTYFGRVFETGDINGDGIFDIVVGMPTSLKQGRPGLVQIYKGKTTGYSNAPSETLTPLIEMTPTDGFGDSVAVLGDVDGDGFADLAVGAPAYFSAAHGTVGQITVFYGSARGFAASGRTQVLDAGADSDFGYFGAVMLGQRDFNGDGYADLIVGTALQGRSDNPAVPFPGNIWIYTGGPNGFSKAPYKRSGAIGSREALGTFVEAADVTHDGQMDIVSGSSTFTGAKESQGVIKVFRGLKGLK